MGCVVQVDGARVATHGAELVRVGGELDELAAALSRVLGAVAGAGGGGDLSEAASAAATRWSAGLHAVAEQGSALGRATQEAAARYAEVEALQAAVWTP